MTVIPEILSLPRAVPSAFAVQTCSSRKPLPTPPPLEYPIEYGAFAAAAPEAPGLELHAAETTAMAARPTSSRLRVDAFVMRSPPSCDRRADLVASPNCLPLGWGSERCVGSASPPARAARRHHPSLVMARAIRRA